jgi:hypothetical protein
MRAPDVTGPFGRAWVVKKPIVKPDHNASLSEWLINVPGAHPFWEYWYAVQAIVNGRISPDQDFRSMWHQLLARTVEHFREGKHPEN